MNCVSRNAKRNTGAISEGPLKRRTIWKRITAVFKREVKTEQAFIYKSSLSMNDSKDKSKWHFDSIATNYNTSHDFAAQSIIKTGKYTVLYIARIKERK